MADTKPGQWPIALPITTLYAPGMAEPGSVLTCHEARDAFHGDVLPRQGDWSDEDYLRLTDCLTRLVEFTDGHVQELPMPTCTHQAVLGCLYRLFHSWLEPAGGIVLFSALRLKVRPGKFREPDLVVLRDAADIRRQDRYWLGADLVVEVVSPDDPDRDLVTKRSDYAEAGIPEYWIADPRDETVTVLNLSAPESGANREGAPGLLQAYAEHGVFRRGQAAASVLLDGFTADVASVFDAWKPRKKLRN